MKNIFGMPRFFNSPLPFAICVILLLAYLAFRGCELPALTTEQRASEAAGLAEQQARWDEARQARQARSGFDLAVYVLSRLALLVLALGAGAGLISVLTLYGWRRAATIAPTGGLFPLILSKLDGKWRVYDANKSPVPSAALSDTLVAPGWELAQLAVTAGAQGVQAEQARSYSVQVAPTTPAPTAVEPAGEAAPVVMNWPGRVPLTRYLDAQGGASLDNVFMGVTCDPETGQQTPVSMAMDDLVHFAVAGSSGFGKTTFVESLLYQFVKTEACDLAIVDLKAELVAWRYADALRWPIATTRQDGGAILSACYDELETRKNAFESVGGCKNLTDYNARANGAGQFRPLVAVLDEATVLLKSDKELTNMAMDLVLLGRSLGLWLLLAAQNFKVSSTASEVRDQLTTRVQFHAQDGNQARILLGHDKAQGLGVGRAIARLSGHDGDIELQAPIVSRQEIDTLLRGQSGARQPAPVVVAATPVKAKSQPVARLTPDQEVYALELGERGLTTTAIQKEIWGENGKSGGRARAINELLHR